MGGNSWALWGPDPAVMFQSSTQLGAGSLEKMSLWNRGVEIDSVRAYYDVCTCVHAHVVWHACGGAHMCICTCGACVFSVLCSMYLHISVCCICWDCACMWDTSFVLHGGFRVCVGHCHAHTSVCVYVGFACMCWAYSWAHLCVCMSGLHVCAWCTCVHTKLVSMHVQVHCTPAPVCVDMTTCVKTPSEPGSPRLLPSSRGGESAASRPSAHLLSLSGHGCTRHLLSSDSVPSSPRTPAVGDANPRDMS